MLFVESMTKFDGPRLTRSGTLSFLTRSAGAASEPTMAVKAVNKLENATILTISVSIEVVLSS